ncbi:MAG: Mrp/NBP35 family ATP-binding protein [Rhodospirillales bacterium]|nr:Mrp/NBP35 family ATP-binding protein [Rhodospirillales bacterium]MCB9996340.1 Mrp/NBP35 family ATP-binding protein [Rhodospirillales bacterium]
MSGLNEDIIKAALDKVNPGCAVSGIRIADGAVTFIIEVDPKAGPEMEQARQQAEAAVRDLPGVEKVTAIMTARREGGSPKKTAQLENLAPGIRHIIAVASGKGGVGKSTVATNLAVALAAQGHKVGLMDADIYGPSAPMMLGVHGKPELRNEKLVPHEAYGLKIMSMGFLVEEDAPMIWRGPMIQSALRQFLADVDWGDTEILIVDMPPGTGDAQLTMAQKVPLAGAVIVSTPQDIALLDARKGLNMFRQVGVPVLGIIENMSVYVCPECGHEEHIFGHEGAEKEAARLGLDFLGAIPLHREIRETSDAGKPVTVSHPDSPYARTFMETAQRIARVLNEQPKRLQA